MAVPVNQITTLQQAYTYAVEAAAAAQTVCPAAKAAYQGAASAISAKQVQADISFYDDETAVQDAVALLKSANAKCTASKVTTVPAATPSEPATTTPTAALPKPSPAGVSAGLPWWAWGLIAAGAVWAIKGTKKTKKRAAASRRRRKVRRSRRRARRI